MNAELPAPPPPPSAPPPPPSAPSTPPPRWTLAAPLLLAALAGALTLDGGFVYDDQHAILGSPVVQGSVGLAEALTERDFWGLPLGGPAKVSWRPALPLLWRGLWLLGGGAPWPFRLLNLLAHVAAVAAALALARALLAQRAAPTRAAHALAALAACLFAVHPLQAEAVGAIVGGADVLAFAAVAAALAHALRRPGAANLATAAALVGVGCLCKETAIGGLVLLAALAWARRDGARAAAALAAVGVPLAALVLAMVARAHGGASEQASDNVLAALAPADRYALAFAIAGRAALDTLLPLTVAPNFSHGVYSADVKEHLPLAAVGALALAAAAGAALRALVRRDAAALIALGLWAMPVVAVSNLLYVAPTEYAQRLLYGALLPTCLAVAALLASSRRALPAAALLLAALLALRAREQRPWHDQRALFERAIEVAPRSWRIQHNLGDALARAGETPRALWHLLLAAHLQRIRPAAADWPRIEALGALEPQERLLLAPAALAGPDACGLIDALVRKAWGKPGLKREAAAARAVFAGRYDCGARSPTASP